VTREALADRPPRPLRDVSGPGPRPARPAARARVLFTGAGRLWGLLALLAAAAGCRQASEVPEDGALMLRINAAPSGQRPDELRVSAYADNGVLFDGTRFPAAGALPAAAGSVLGSILVSPGNVVGNLRVYVRGLYNSQTVEAGAVVLPPAARNRTTVDLFLADQSVHDADSDGDGIPDEIDDCPTVSDPLQLGCPTPVAGGADAAADGAHPQPQPPPPTQSAPDAAVGLDASGPARDASVSQPPGDPRDASSTGPRDAPTAGSGTGGGGGGGHTGHPGSGGSPGGGGSSPGSAGAASAGDAGASDGGTADAAAGTGDPDAATGGASDAASGATDAVTPLGKGLGSPCQAGAECRSQFCADGVCCNSACDQPCRACFFGFCLAIVRAPDVPQCSGAMTCNQSAMCVANPTP
jgi:hypothetical protein